MDIDKVRALTDGELEDQLKEAKQDLWQARFQLNTRQLKDYSSIPQTRRTIARILTVQRERLDGQVEEVEPAAELEEETEDTSTPKPRRIARILQRERRAEPAEEVEPADELEEETEDTSTPKPRRIARILQRERRVEPAEEVEETPSDELDAEPEAASQPTGGDEEITR